MDTGHLITSDLINSLHEAFCSENIESEDHPLILRRTQMTLELLNTGPVKCYLAAYWLAKEADRPIDAQRYTSSVFVAGLEYGRRIAEMQALQGMAEWDDKSLDATDSTVQLKRVVDTLEKIDGPSSPSL